MANTETRRKKVVAATIERQMRSIDKVLSLSNVSAQKSIPIYASDKVAETAIIASSTIGISIPVSAFAFVKLMRTDAESLSRTGFREI